MAKMTSSWGSGPLDYLQKMTKEEIEKVGNVFVDWLVLDDHKFERAPDDVDAEIAKWDILKKDCSTLQENMEKSYTAFCKVVLAPLAKIK